MLYLCLLNIHIFYIFQIALDIQHRAENYDSCNALVLPTQKRKTKNVDQKVKNIKLLSKKHRKQLEKVVERKKKKLQVLFIQHRYNIKHLFKFFKYNIYFAESSIIRRPGKSASISF